MPTKAEFVEFVCPGCGRSCRLNTERRSLQHAKPICAVYESTKADGQTFLKLAKVASQPKGGKLVRTN